MPIHFAEKQPDVYMLSTIYDSATDGAIDSDHGKFVPAVGSVVNDVTVDPPQAWVVTAVDPVTYDSTLKPMSSLLESGGIDRLVTYNNKHLMLFFDTRTTPTKLRVDSNVMIYGDKSVNYKLFRLNGDGTETCISLYIDGTDTVVGQIVPVNELTSQVGSGIRHPIDCYTSEAIVADDIIYMRVYDAADTMTMEVKLISKEVSLLTDLESNSTVITGYDVSANQQLGDGTFILFGGQNRDDLAIFPKLTFNDGRILDAPLGSDAFMYNYDAINTDIVGSEYDVLFKQFLNPDMVSAISGGNGVFVDVTKTVRIVAPNGGVASKLVAAIYWNGTSYSIKYIAYFEERNKILDVTTSITYTSGSFDSSAVAHGNAQTFSVACVLVDDDGNNYTHSQDFNITTYADTNTPRYINIDTVDPVLIYNQHDINHTMPLLKYNGTSKLYSVPVGMFATDEKFVENFYINHAPAPVGNESVAPNPTHFIVRDITDLITKTVAPIEIGDYANEFNLVGTDGQYTNGTVYVEFLEYVGGVYTSLGGGPVQVTTI